MITYVRIREGFKTPSHEKKSVRGVPTPPPGPQRTRFFCKVSEKNLTEKGGTPPPPLTDDPLPKMDFFPPKTAFFAQKTLFNGFFPPPLKRTVRCRKINGKKLTERRGTPPKRKVSVPGVFEPFP